MRSCSAKPGLIGLLLLVVFLGVYTERFVTYLHGARPPKRKRYPY